MNHLSHCLIFKNLKKHKPFPCFPVLCVCDCCHSARHHNLFPQLLGTISKLPGDQLALETQWWGCGDNLLKLRKKCYKQTGPQEHSQVQREARAPVRKNKPGRSVRNVALMAFPPGSEQASPGLVNDEGPEPRKQMRLQPQAPKISSAAVERHLLWSLLLIRHRLRNRCFKSYLLSLLSPQWPSLAHQTDLRYPEVDSLKN